MVNFELVKNIILMLFLTIGIILVLAFILKHFKKMIPQFQGVVEVLGGANIGPKTKVVLIKTYQTQMLIGFSDSHIQTLHVFNDNELTLQTGSVQLESVGSQ